MVEDIAERWDAVDMSRLARCSNAQVTEEIVLT